MTQHDDDSDEFLAIDEHRLDEEWANQPRRYYRYAKLVADARQRHAEAKAQLEVTEAELDRKIRAAPAEYGLEKITETVVRNTVVLQKRHKLAVAELIEAKHEVDVLEAAVSALDHRKKALENTVQLFLANYFATPRAPRAENGDDGHDMNEVVKRDIRKRGQLKKVDQECTGQ